LDEELERIKRRRMQELQRRMLKEEKAEEKPEKPPKPTPKEILDAMFSGRAWEVYETAKIQYPTVMPQVEQARIPEAAGAQREAQHIDPLQGAWGAQDHRAADQGEIGHLEPVFRDDFKLPLVVN
jgi:DNA-binding TFAR19-related protein (PDSD5 family)